MFVYSDAWESVPTITKGRGSIPCIALIDDDKNYQGEPYSHANIIIFI